jgi:hypothetical protein
VRHHIIALTIVAWLCAAQATQAQSVATSTAGTERTPSTETDSDGEAAKEPAGQLAPGPRVSWYSTCGVDDDAFDGARVPDTTVYRAAPDGACFCSMLAARGTHASRRHTFAGWALGTLAVGLVVVGAVLGNESSGNVLERERGTLLAISGLAVAPLSYYFFSRAERDSTAASRATQAQGEGQPGDDAAMYRACTAAKADWVASREAEVAFSTIAVERLEKAAAQSKHDAASAAANADEALKAADAATRASEQAQQSAEAAEAAGEADAASDEDEGERPAGKKPAR